MPTNQLIICETCDHGAALNGPGVDVDTAVASLEAELASSDLAHRISVRKTACMGACETPVTLALQGEGRATVVFAGLSLPEDLDDIIATCQTYLDSPKGWIEDARPCGRLRLCLRSRVPAL